MSALLSFCFGLRDAVYYCCTVNVLALLVPTSAAPLLCTVCNALCCGVPQRIVSCVVVDALAFNKTPDPVCMRGVPCRHSPSSS